MLPLIVTLPSESNDKAPCCSFTPSSSIALHLPAGNRQPSSHSRSAVGIDVGCEGRVAKSERHHADLARCTVMPYGPCQICRSRVTESYSGENVGHRPGERAAVLPRATIDITEIAIRFQNEITLAATITPRPRAMRDDRRPPTSGIVPNCPLPTSQCSRFSS